MKDYRSDYRDSLIFLDAVLVELPQQDALAFGVDHCKARARQTETTVTEPKR